LRNTKVGIFSPASATHAKTSARFQRAYTYLVEKGLYLMMGSLIYEKYLYCSGNIEERADELNNLIYSDCDYLFASIGGLNSASILPLIDYCYLIDNPKIFIGNSDVTSILSAVYTKAKLSSYYYMTLLPAFGEIGFFLEENYKYFKQIILNKPTSYNYKMPSFWTDEWINWEKFEREKKRHSNKWLPLSYGKTEAILVGGNFSTLVKLCGTPFLFDFTDKILFLEDTQIDASTLESNIMIFEQNGVFKKIRGLILGKCELYDDMGTELCFSEWFVSFIKRYSFPILGEFDCGHTHPCLPLLIGGNYLLDINSNTCKLSLREKGVVL